jgi:hypothetical protein
MGKGIQSRGSVTFTVTSLVAAGEEDVPEGPILRSLLDGDVVVAPVAVPASGTDVTIAIREPQDPGEWWVLVVGGYGVTFFPLSGAELEDRRGNGLSVDQRNSPTVVEEVCQFQADGTVRCELWNVKVRNVTRDPLSQPMPKEDEDR